MKQFIRQMLVIARRDFTAVVLTPSFLLFLLAPLMMVFFGVVGGLGAAHMADSREEKREIIVIAPKEAGPLLLDADARLRSLHRKDEMPLPLRIVSPDTDVAVQAKTLFSNTETEVYAVLYGPLDRPAILRGNNGKRSATYLAELAEQSLRSTRADIAPGVHLSKANIVTADRAMPSKDGRMSIGYIAVFIIFLLTILLAGQSVGMLAEEKSNKVIEILAAAVPLEAVFAGKLLGLFVVAILFVTFWGSIAISALQMGAAYMPVDAPTLVSLTPAIGFPAFFLFAILYFTAAYMLLGAVFLGVGAQAGTVREIQMLSLPITLFQFGMFGLSSAAATSPGSTIARIAEIFPFSSPFAMAARGASDPALWPHFLALCWQTLWVALTIYFAARLFRRGVLKSGSEGNIFSFLKRQRS